MGRRSSEVSRNAGSVSYYDLDLVGAYRRLGVVHIDEPDSRPQETKDQATLAGLEDTDKSSLSRVDILKLTALNR